MRVLNALVSLAVAVDVVVGSGWYTKAAYNKWHETELERWLSDHDVPYPTPADRKDLENLVQQNWNSYVVAPYEKWDAEELGNYLKLKGIETKDVAAENKDSLLAQVKDQWYETEDKAQQAYGSVKDWILDTWSDSQLKEFCDKHGIPVPQPRKRDTVLQKARSSYETIAQKAGEATAYPGNWLYETWTESDLKEWLDSHGFPAPQPTTRDKLVSSVRRNSRLAYLKMQDQAASATASAQATYQTLTDMVIDAWGESQLKEFCDKNAISVPQGSKENEIRALVRKHRAEILGDNVSGSAASAYGAATSNVGSQFAQATDSVASAYQKVFDSGVDTWTDSRLKAYLDERGVPVPHGSKTEELRALVRKNAHKASTRGDGWTWDDLSYDHLKDYLLKTGDDTAKKAAEKSGSTRDDLVSAANSAYTSASKAGGGQYATATSYLAQHTGAAKKNLFDSWSESDLKSYLDSYGIPVHQGSTINELRANARKQYTYFKYGTTTPSETFLARLEESVKDGWEWVKDQLHMGSEAAKQKAGEATEKAKQEL